MRGLRWAWALPLTVLGLPFWLMALCSARGHAYAQHGFYGWVLLAHSSALAALLKHHPFGQMQALAVGCCVFASDSKTLALHLPHELVHVRQAQQWGMVFPFAYLLSSVWQLMHGRHAYDDNYFERQANSSDHSSQILS